MSLKVGAISAPDFPNRDALGKIDKRERPLKEVLNTLVDKVNRSALKTIYTYTGDEKHEPIYYEETALFKEMLTSIGISCRVVEVSDETLLPDTWDPTSSLLHIPGAMSSELDKHIGAKIPAIRKFVEDGGRFLGWCGGGYWACREVRYRVDENTTMVKLRNLSFWKGIEEGPLMPYLGNPEGNIGFFHGAVKVRWGGSPDLQALMPQGLTFNVLLSGGGAFVPDPQEHLHKVLASYCDYPHQSRAAVKCQIGKGVAVMVNPYFTHGANYFIPGLEGYEKHFPLHPWRKIVEDLKGNDLQRCICFADMLLETTIV